MNVSQVKLANFEQMVLREAETKRDEIIAKLTRIKRGNKIKAQIERETTNYIEKTETWLKKTSALKSSFWQIKSCLRKETIFDLLWRIRTRLVKFAASPNMSGTF